MAAQPGLCRTWSETPKTGFLTTRLILSVYNITLTYLCSILCSRLSIWEVYCRRYGRKFCFTARLFSVAVKHYFRPYIRQYTPQNESLNMVIPFLMYILAFTRRKDSILHQKLASPARNFTHAVGVYRKILYVVQSDITLRSQVH